MCFVIYFVCQFNSDPSCIPFTLLFLPPPCLKVLDKSNVVDTIQQLTQEPEDGLDMLIALQRDVKKIYITPFSPV
ncbi:LOW QUALITY PROTEIN: hypothetical protein ACHAW6_004935 [Cyclotella cf. meneghiniana]